ncbi:type IV toxin-antitoxin system AbiEi family antitoxin domain-containing protein [Phycicoccus sp. MAQZ13P-2]|uniref:type IV toxin-antitoxin system AbiEi family antitoxin domain-containing protein n=1 Tax=Phycicoccus mangrovi TaxID=2840470 RepID=UPI001C002E4B|nr:type IV toxin-antitoxin system AbiEi family antitoxin domain-containing protein [Phycicoccus mangrovi]MBT9273449.1 type IV toxin-antitoxin system AbiEi family antitoxin domain-containing protein [Phycicoccus mangrovi]
MDDTDDLSFLGQLHDGVFTTAEAHGLGVSREVLTRAVKARTLRRLARGLYATGPAAARAEDRHLELCRALRVEYPDASLAGRSAVVALGLPTWGLPLGTAPLHRPVERQLKRSGATIRPLDPVADLQDTSFGPVEPPCAALVGLALDHGTVAAVASADEALHRRLVTPDELAGEVARRAGHRHVQRALAMLRLVDAASESPGESRTRVTLESLGLELDSQVEVRDEDGEFVGRVDLVVRGTKVLIEFDGAVKYSAGGPEAVVAEKRREDRLRELGYVVVRVMWDDLAHPERLLARVRRAMALAERLTAGA